MTQRNVWHVLSPQTILSNPAGMHSAGRALTNGFQEKRRARFAQLFHADSVYKDQRGRVDVTLSLADSTPFGITLCNRYGKVIIKISNKNNAAFRNGVRNGDVILYVNDIPMSTHHNVVNVINSAKSNHVSITLTVVKSEQVLLKKRLSYMCSFFRKCTS